MDRREKIANVPAPKVSQESEIIWGRDTFLCPSPIPSSNVSALPWPITTNGNRCSLTYEARGARTSDRKEYGVLTQYTYIHTYTHTYFHT